ncbi:hypothetical protein HGM15179_021132, partial [Zosterops borbonicus]
ITFSPQASAEPGGASKSLDSPELSDLSFPLAKPPRQQHRQQVKRIQLRVQELFAVISGLVLTASPFLLPKELLARVNPD